jgi:tetratricopeptide (TPR) repeat protein
MDLCCSGQRNLSPSTAAQDAPGHAATTNQFIDALRTAKIASAAGRWTEAARGWERVVQMNPVNEEYWQDLAEARYKSGDFKQAIPAFEKVLDLGGYCFL